MPRKLNTNFVRRRFNEYGYRVPENFNYVNNITHIRVYDEYNNCYENITYKMLTYRINHGRPSRNDTESQEFITQLMNMPLSQETPRIDKEFITQLMNMPLSQETHSAKDPRGSKVRRTIDKNQNINSLVKKLLKEKTFILNFENNEPGSKEHINALYTLLNALKIAAPKIDKDIRMTIETKYNEISYAHVNQNTIDVLEYLLEYNDFNLSDSNDVLVFNINDYKQITFEFIDFKKGKRITAAFFPYYNISDIDLSSYGIYHKDEWANPESCLITAFRSSGILDENEMNLLTSFIKTKSVPREELKNIAETFKTHIICKVHYDEKTSTREFGKEYERWSKGPPERLRERKIKLHILSNHYILDKDVNVTPFYIKHYEQINSDVRFKNHPRKHMLKRFDDNKHDPLGLRPERPYGSYEFDKKPCNIIKVIKTMIDNKLLIPMTNNEIRIQKFSEGNSWALPAAPFGAFRLIHVKDKQNLLSFLNMPKQTKGAYLFGYDPEDDEINSRLDELQNVINQLNLRHHVNVRLYYKFSELMQKIMFEYGCLDNVYELTGTIQQKIISSLKTLFPKTIWNKELINGTLYYIDQAGAYMSSVKSIPAGVSDDDGNFKTENTKIKELIEKLYEFRINAKNNGNDKLATTLKFMMNSCWGYSMKKPKLIKHKFVKDVNKYIETYAPYVVKYNNNYVDTIKPYVENYSYPQFARSVLTNFNSKMKELSNKVNILYSKVDSALITEEDYLKLKKDGMIGNCLGQFKVEHVFTQFYAKSAEQWIGKNIDGTYHYHLTKNLKEICMKMKDPIRYLMSLKGARHRDPFRVKGAKRRDNIFDVS